MRSGWYTPKEIAQLQGMPSTIQGVHKRAKKEGWKTRKRVGVQGNAVEYNLFDRSRPAASSMLEMKESSTLHLEAESYLKGRAEVIWQLAFRQCTNQEQCALVKHLMAHGITSFLAVTDPYQLKIARLIRSTSAEQLRALLNIETQHKVASDEK